MNVTRWDYERAIAASDLPAPSRLILLTLATRADTDTGRIPDEYSPSHALLASETGLSRRTVIDHLAAVETLGWLGVRRAPVAQQRAQHTPNHYRLALPKSAAKLVQQAHPAPPKASATAAPGGSATAAPPSAAPAPGASAAPAQASATAAHNQTKELTTNHQAPSGASRASAGTRTRDRLAELNATAVTRPDSYALVSTWARNLTPPIRDTTQRQLAKAIDELRNDLRADLDLGILRAALDLWATNGRTPNYLPYAYDDATRAARAAQTPTVALDVPGSRVHQPAGSDRASKALGFLDPRDPYLAQLGRSQQQPGQLRAIEGGRSA